MKLFIIIKYILLEQKNRISLNNLFSFFLFSTFYIFFFSKSINVIIKIINSFTNTLGLMSFLNFITLFIFLNWVQTYMFNFNILIKEVLDNTLAANVLHFPINTATIFHFKSFQMFINLFNWINHLFVLIPLLISISILLKASFYKIIGIILIYFLLDYSINVISIISVIFIINIIPKSLIEFILFMLNCLLALSFSGFIIMFLDQKYVGIKIYENISGLINSSYIDLLPSKWLINIISSNSFEKLFFNSLFLLIFSVVLLYGCTYIFQKNFEGFFYDKNYELQRKSSYSKQNNKFWSLLKFEFKLLFNFRANIIYSSIYIFILFISVNFFKYENNKLLALFFIVCYIVGMISTIGKSKIEKNQILVYQMFPIKFIHIYLSKFLVCVVFNSLIAYTVMMVLYIWKYLNEFNIFYLSLITGIIVVLMNLLLLDIGLYFQKESKFNSDFIAIMYLILFIVSYLWSFNIFITLILITFFGQHELRIKIFKKYENGELI